MCIVIFISGHAVCNTVLIFLPAGGDTESPQERGFCWKHPQARGKLILGTFGRSLLTVDLCFQLDRIRYVLCSYLRNRIQKVSPTLVCI